jgi:hypothetical protein
MSLEKLIKELLNQDQIIKNNKLLLEVIKRNNESIEK